ncbi:DUF559 domain-containing protein [Pseudactinotalea sp. HY160]|nr:DUF559 domain-containing protein [Pseudactinotalea sp. HY160]
MHRCPQLRPHHVRGHRLALPPGVMTTPRNLKTAPFEDALNAASPHGEPPPSSPPARARRRQSEADAAGLFRTQHGLIARGQVLATGLTDEHIRHRLALGLWVRVYSGVYCLAGTRRTRLCRCVAALLYCGPNAYLSHDTAAYELGLIYRPYSATIHVTLPHSTRVRAQTGLKIHRTRLPAEPRRTSTGLVVADPVRTLVDLAATLSSRDLQAVLHDGIFKKIVTLNALYDGLSEPRHVPGFSALRREIEVFDRESDSGREAEAGRLFRRAGMSFIRRYEVWGDEGGHAILDFAHVPLKLDVEIDGAAYHADPAAQARDRERDRMLIRLGWQVLRIPATDVRTRPDDVVELVRAALAQRAGIHGIDDRAAG